MSPLLSTQEYVDGIVAGDRAILGRAITLVESVHPQHREAADELLHALLPRSGGAQRVGITGVPGVGKSTFIEAFGTNLTEAGHRVAVLAVDPTSSRTGGSILGDKTRMPNLSANKAAFIRPSPSSGTLGGVTRATRETMTVVEAAGYDVVLVETVGVGQSETTVHGMVDFFLVLMIAGAGDELQGIKKGVLEMADMIAVNKADGDNDLRARAAALAYTAALRLLEPASPNWSPPVLTCSGLHGAGLDEIWSGILDHQSRLTESGERAARRRDQQLGWMWAMVDDRLRAELHEHPGVAAVRLDVEAHVEAGTLTPARGADQLLDTFWSGISDRRRVEPN